MTSHWLAEAAPPVQRLTLDGPPDAIVVGGGVTGCAAALTLAQAGLRVRLHEAREVGGGASGRNGGIAGLGAAIPYREALQALGAAAARALWLESERALERIAGLAGDAFRRVGTLTLADDAAEAEALRAEHDALRRDGFAAEWLEPVPRPLRSLFTAGLRQPAGGAIQPARWVRRLAARAARAGVEIRERSRVTLDELDAPAVLVATDGLGRGLAPELDAAIRPTRGQVVVTAPLPGPRFPCPCSARNGFDYWQQLPDRRLVFGGCRDAALDDEWTDREETTEAVQARIEAGVERLLGSRPPIERRWAGIWGTTADRLPLAGPVPGRPGLRVAAGYSGHGNVLGFACGELVARAILGDRDPLLDLLDPARALGTRAGQAPPLHDRDSPQV